MDIHNRRYLGSKSKLIPFIKRVVEEECTDIKSVADIFAGTGVVANAFKDKMVITNDLLYSNYIAHCCFLGSEAVDTKKIKRMIDAYNESAPAEDNYMSVHFSDTYFSAFNCRKIGWIREDIEELYSQNAINERERACLITSLLYAMDRIANTCGHYDAYRKGEDLDKVLYLQLPNLTKNHSRNEFYHMDSNELVRRISADLVYIDPPYNSRQYCDAYHLLENVARWEKPRVSGTARKMDRSALKSEYCLRSAPDVFADLIENIQAKYILVSYSNMGKKGNDRSNARISDKDIVSVLEKKGTVKVFEQDYRAFTTGKSDIKEHKERLFLCIVQEKKQYRASPLNYIGGKYKLLDQILPFFPANMDTFIDLFAGGCNVGINVNAKKVKFYDHNEYLTGLLNSFKTNERFFECVLKVIDKYQLTRSWEDGYPADSSDGLAAFNKENFLKLREDFNRLEKKDETYYVMLYVLIVYSFNNQIRFNKKGQFNLPVGKRDFNKKMQKKLNEFSAEIKKDMYSVECRDFRDFRDVECDGFVYCDPPYLIATAGYNENGGWTEKDEKDLLALLDKLHSQGKKWALSNVLTSKGKENRLLIEWSKKYNVHHLNNSYANSNYQTKGGETDEVLITNY